MVAPNELDEAAEQRLYVRLRRYWHPVLFADDLADAPRGVTLLGERVVVVRLAGGVSAFRDLCVHRGSALSVGRVIDGDRLECRYHGWTYDQDGACVRIPSRPGMNIPPRARAQRYDAAEHAGLIWVCLDSPAALPLPPYPEASDTTYQTMRIPTYDWRCGAARRIENFVDVSHFPFVHEGLLGDPRRPEVPDYQVVRGEASLRFAAGLELQPANSFKRDGADADALVPRDPIEYAIYMPYTVHLSQPLAEGKRYVLFMAASPVTRHETRSFSFGSRNYDLGGDGYAEWVEYQKLILEQDREVVETQRPEELPVDLAAELHIRNVDGASVEYRRWLAQIANQQLSQ